MPRVANAALLSALLLTACGQSQDAAQDAGKKGGPPGGMPPAMVSIVNAEPQDLAVELEYTAQTVGYRDVEVRARVPGILLTRSFEEGSRVGKGQPLFSIESAPFEAALARAEADLAAAQARSDQTRRTLGRLKTLREAGMVTQSTFDDALAAEAVTAAEVKSARARLDEAKLNLGYTRVLSPATGIISRAERAEGTLVAGPETLLASITQVDPVYVVFGMPDNEQLRLRREAESGQLLLPKQGRFDVEVRLSDGSIYPRRGKLDFSDVRINAATGTSDARTTLANPEGLLRPGQFVRVRLTGAMRPKAIKVPQRAVLEGAQGKFVYVVNDKSQAEPRPVKAGEWAGNDWIISEGLKAGDRVIVDGVMRIGPGAPVQVAEPAKPGAAPASAPVQPPAAENSTDTPAPKGEAPPARDAKK